MARKASVRYWQSRGAYCCEHKGKQHVLAVGPDDRPEGPTYKAAVEAYKLLCFPPQAGEEINGKTVATVLNLYRDHMASKWQPNTVAIKDQLFRPFEEAFGHKVVQYLRPAEVEEWLDEMRKPRWNARIKRECRWGDGSCRMAIECLNAAFAWAVKREHISRNPIKGVERVAAGSRSEDALISPEDHARVLKVAKRALRDFIIVLEATGCRPGELANATAAHFDPMLRAIVYRAKPRDGGFRHKTANKGKDRRILLTGEALAIILRRIKRYPRGPLFPKTRYANSKHTGPLAQPWNNANIVHKFIRLADRLNLPHFTAYSYRHTMITRLLRAGMSVEKVAALMGNTPAVIHKFYDHVIKYTDELRAELEGILAMAPATVPPLPQESVQEAPQGGFIGIMDD